MRSQVAAATSKLELLDAVKALRRAFDTGNHIKWTENVAVPRIAAKGVN